AARELAVAELVDADAGQADSLTARRNRALGRDHGAARSVTSERAASSSASLRSGWWARSTTLRALRRRAKFPRCLGGSGGRLASHRLVDHMPVMPLRLLGEVLQRPAVFLIHLRAVGGPLVCLFALEDNAHPDLIWVGHALEDRVVDPTLGRRSLEPLHLGDKLIQAAWLDAVLRDGSVHFGALLRQVDGQILSMAQPSSPGNR